jgi:helicase
VSELYLDPYTADYLIKSMQKAPEKKIKDISFLQMISQALELRPLLNIKVSEYDKISAASMEYSENFFCEEPSMFEEDYEEYLKSIKTTLFFYDWINEVDEEHLLESYNVRPGEIRVKLDLADWLLYSSEELAKLSKMHGLVKEIEKLRMRLKQGAKEELIPLLRFDGIGRVRARKLFNNKIQDVEDVKKIDLQSLSNIVGKAIALSLKKQVGQHLEEKDVVVPKGKRIGQTSLEKY